MNQCCHNTKIMTSIQYPPKELDTAIATMLCQNLKHQKTLKTVTEMKDCNVKIVEAQEFYRRHCLCLTRSCLFQINILTLFSQFQVLHRRYTCIKVSVVVLQCMALFRMSSVSVQMKTYAKKPQSL